MKTTCNFTIRSFFLAAALSAGLGCMSPAFGQVTSYLIGPNGEVLTPRGIPGAARSVNDSGQVVGATNAVGAVNGYGHTEAFFTGPGGVGITLIPDAIFAGGSGVINGADDINDSGQVVGSFAIPETRGSSFGSTGFIPALMAWA